MDRPEGHTLAHFALAHPGSAALLEPHQLRAE
jgi:hypothetical protein